MNNKRKIVNFLIKKNIQFRIAVISLFCMIIATLVTGLVIYVSVMPMIADFVPYALQHSLHVRIAIRLLLMSIPLIFLMVIGSVLISHRIAGPVYKMEKVLDGILQGKEIEPIRLRKGDMLLELAEKINKILERLKT